jgi:excinuclease UvrABC nuclease subunit
MAVPEQSGCYAIVNYGGDVLYLGLATRSIRDRMEAHLETPAKRKAGNLGAPFWLYYVVRPAVEVLSIERGWMNQAILEDGSMPPLNKIYSPL